MYYCIVFSNWKRYDVGLWLASKLFLKQIFIIYWESDCVIVDVILKVCVVFENCSAVLVRLWFVLRFSSIIFCFWIFIYHLLMLYPQIRSSSVVSSFDASFALNPSPSFSWSFYFSPRRFTSLNLPSSPSWVFYFSHYCDQSHFSGLSSLFSVFSIPLRYIFLQHFFSVAFPLIFWCFLTLNLPPSFSWSFYFSHRRFTSLNLLLSFCWFPYFSNCSEQSFFKLSTLFYVFSILLRCFFSLNIFLRLSLDLSIYPTKGSLQFSSVFL